VGVLECIAQGGHGGAGERAELAQHAGRVQPPGRVPVAQAVDPDVKRLY